MISRYMLLISALFALAACDNTTSRYSDDYATKLSRNELLILPAYAEADMVDATGNETRKYDYEDHIEPILADELQKKLEEKGYHARILHKRDLMQNKDYLPYEAFKESFKTAYGEAYKKGPMIKREEASKSVIPLGGRGKALGEKLHAPLMVYIDYSEKVSTGGAQAADMAVGILTGLLTGVNKSNPPDKANIVVAIIDSENDRIIWTNPGASAGGGMVASMVYTDEEQSLQHIHHSIDFAVKDLPDRADLFKQDKR